MPPTALVECCDLPLRPSFILLQILGEVGVIAAVTLLRRANEKNPVATPIEIRQGD